MQLTENCQVYTNNFCSAFLFVLRIISLIVGGDLLIFTLTYIIHVHPFLDCLCMFP